MSLIQQIKDSTTCLAVANRLSSRVWEYGRNRWHFEHGGKAKDFSSTYILTDKDRWGVSSLGVGGDCIDLAEFLLYGTVKHKQDEARQYLADWLKITKGVMSQLEHHQYQRQVEYRNFIEHAHQNLMADARYQKVIADRGVTLELMREFNIGFATLQSYGTVHADFHAELGLNTDSGYKLMLDRFVFPVYNSRNVVNICGWTPDPKEQKRYLNLANRPQWPWNINAGDQDSAKPIWIVEGIFDALSIISAGFPAIAMLRAIPSERPEFLALLQEVKGRTVKLALDYDSVSHAGDTGALKLLRLLIHQNTPVSVVEISPSIFDVAAGAGTIIRDGMTVSELADIFQISTAYVKSIITDAQLLANGGTTVTNGNRAVEAIKKNGLRERRTISADGILREYIDAAKAYYGDIWPPKKIDMNDIWVIGEKNKKIITTLGERAMLGLSVYLRRTVETAGQTEDELIHAAKAEILKFPDLDKRFITQALSDCGVSPKKLSSAVPTSKEALNPIVLYSDLLQEILPIRYFENNNLFAYDEDSGIWRVQPKEYYDSVLRKHVIPESKTIADLWVKIQQEVTSRHLTPAKEFEEKQARYVTMKNGTFDTHNLAFIPSFSPSYYATAHMNIFYDPKAECPKFQQTLYEMFTTPNDEEQGFDTTDKIQAVREMLGLLLTKDMSFQRIWFWHGSGGNGKGMLVRLFEKIVGHDNMASLALSQLGDDKVRVALVGKRINFGQENDDNTSSYINASTLETIKTISGNDLITINPKFLTPFMTRLYMHLVFPVNKVPNFAETNDAIKRRLNNSIILFPVSFRKVDKPSGRVRPIIYNKERDLDDELSGIFNWLIEGYRNLRERGDLIELEDCQQLIIDRMLERNTFKFFNAMLVETGREGDKLELDELLMAYQNWYNFLSFDKRFVITRMEPFFSEIQIWLDTTITRINLKQIHNVGRKGFRYILTGCKLNKDQVAKKAEWWGQK